MKTAVRLGAVCAFASLIAGCGGGSGTLLGGSSPSPSATTAEQPLNSQWGHWFHQPDTVPVTVGGHGSVTSSPAGIDCTGSSGCSKSFPVGSTVTLSPFATVAAGIGGTTGSGGTTSSGSTTSVGTSSSSVAAGIGGTTGSGGKTSNGSTQASTPTTTQASAQQVISPAFYVSPTGSDSNAGTSAGAPFLTLGKAKTAMEGSSTKVTYLMGGTYSLSATLTLSTSDNGESWLGFPGQIPVLDGGDFVDVGIAITTGASNITIRWLTIQHFIQMGIWATAAQNLVLDSNTIQYISTIAGITQSNGSNLQFTHNLIQNCNQDGISLSGGANGLEVTNLLVQDNLILNVMLTGTDGGGIYFINAQHGSIGVVINNNVIGNYGKIANQTKAIYLDSNASTVTVTNNIVYGTGTWAMMVHGGDNNTFENNIIDLTNGNQVGLYQTLPGGPDYGMANNVFKDNIIYSSATPPSELWTTFAPGRSDATPVISNNLYYDTIGTPPYSVAPADINPTVANPGFVNAAANNYNFVSGAPAISGGSFALINVSTVGPIPNP